MNGKNTNGVRRVFLGEINLKQIAVIQGGDEECVCNGGYWVAHFVLLGCSIPSIRAYVLEKHACGGCGMAIVCKLEPTKKKETNESERRPSSKFYYVYCTQRHEPKLYAKQPEAIDLSSVLSAIHFSLRISCFWPMYVSRSVRSGLNDIVHAWIIH